MAEPTPEDIRAQYGFVAMLAQQVPEIGGLMQRAVNEKWTADRFSMAVASTNWWKQTPTMQRQWVTQQVSDPASAAAALKDGGAQVATLAARMGFLSNVFNQTQAQQAWLYARLHGFEEPQTRAYIASLAAPKTVGLGQVGGEFGKWMTDFRSLAQNYGFPRERADQLLNQWASTAWASGQGDLSGLQQHLVNYASSKYAPFAERIRGGETVTDIARPYMDVYAQTLEVNPQEIGLDDNYVQRWLQGRSEAGKPPAAIPVWQAQQELRKDARWQYTRNAWEATADVANAIGRAFGMQG